MKLKITRELSKLLQNLVKESNRHIIHYAIQIKISKPSLLKATENSLRRQVFENTEWNYSVADSNQLEKLNPLENFRKFQKYYPKFYFVFFNDWSKNAIFIYLLQPDVIQRRHLITRGLCATDGILTWHFQTTIKRCLV